MASFVSVPQFLAPRGIPAGSIRFLALRNNARPGRPQHPVAMLSSTPASGSSVQQTASFSTSPRSAAAKPKPKPKPKKPPPPVLEKPDKFRPPSHPARRVMQTSNKNGGGGAPYSGQPRNYAGPPLSPEEIEENKKKRYPNSFPPEGTVMFRFLTNRGIHIWISLVYNLPPSLSSIYPIPLTNKNTHRASSSPSLRSHSPQTSKKPLSTHTSYPPGPLSSPAPSRPYLKHSPSTGCIPNTSPCRRLRSGSEESMMWRRGGSIGLRMGWRSPGRGIKLRELERGRRVGRWCRGSQRGGLGFGEWVDGYNLLHTEWKRGRSKLCFYINMYYQWGISCVSISGTCYLLPYFSHLEPFFILQACFNRENNPSLLL